MMLGYVIKLRLSCYTCDCQQQVNWKIGSVSGVGAIDLAISVTHFKVMR